MLSEACPNISLMLVKVRSLIEEVGRKGVTKRVRIDCSAREPARVSRDDAGHAPAGQSPLGSWLRKQRRVWAASGDVSGEDSMVAAERLQRDIPDGHNPPAPFSLQTDKPFQLTKTRDIESHQFAHARPWNTAFPARRGPATMRPSGRRESSSGHRHRPW